MENESPLGGMRSYNFQATGAGITYASMEFKSFSAREVYVDGKQKGEYHIKLTGKKNPSAAIVFLRPSFPDCSIGLADPSGLLNLEYPIYLICKDNPLVMDSIPKTFEKIDEEMNGQTIS